MQKKIESLHKNKSWEFVKEPKGQKIVGYELFNKKGIPGVKDVKFKARLVT